VPILIEHLPVTTCPACQIEEGLAIKMNDEHGYASVLYKCLHCGHVWTRSHRDLNPSA
jgi:uncharacterized Zn finger protein